MPMIVEGRTGGAPQRELADGAMGVADLVFFVLAAAAPLAVMAGLVPVAIARGGVGVPGAFLAVGVVLAVFAVGYSAMSAHVSNAGAFFAYVTHGLGREAGLGAAMLATCCYAGLAMSTGAVFSVFAHDTFADLLGIDVAWPVWFGGAVLVTWWLGHRSIELSAKVLAVALCLEVGILLVVSGAVVLDGGATGLSAAPFAPAEVFGGGAAGVFALVAGSFIGIEATAILSEEAREPRRTVRRATFVAVGVLAVTYAFVTWATVVAFGTELAAGTARADPVGYLFAVGGLYAGDWAVDTMRVLVVTSAFATFLAFHNAASRYVFALARAGVLPGRLAFTHRRYRSPAAANLLHAALIGALMASAALASLDPYLDVFVLTGVPSVAGLIALEALTSLAVVGYFRGDRRGQGVLTAVVAPALAAAGLTAMLVTTAAHIDLLTGRSDATGPLLLGAVATVFVAGVAYAAVLRTRRRRVYEGLAALSLAEP